MYELVAWWQEPGLMSIFYSESRPSPALSVSIFSPSPSPDFWLDLFISCWGPARPGQARPGPGLGTDNLTANKHHNNTNIQLISLSHPPHSLVFLHWKLSQHKMVLRPNRNSKVKTPILSRSWNGWAWPLVYLILTAISGIKFGFSFLGPTGWDRLGHCEINGLLEVCSVLSLSLLLL